MADTKISALTSATPVGTDEIVIVDDPGGTPSSKRATVRSAIQTDILSGAGAPATTPDYVGQRYVDTTADELYVATDTASSADWDKMFSEANSTAYTSSGNTTVVATVSGSFTNGDLVVADANGNLVDGPTPPTGTIVGNTDTQTLTNKTLTSPVLTTPQINDTSADHQYVFAVSELVADRTVTLPLLTGNDTFVFNDHTATLTNKTISLTSNTVSGTTAEFNTALSDGSFATLAGTETLTNKTVNLSSNTITGTTAQFNTALSDGSFATLAGTETLTNKTLTTPTINDPRIAHEYNAQTGTTYTLVAADQSAIITMSNASANTLTIPPNSSVAFPVGTIVTIFQLGAGATTVEGGTGVTVNGVSTGGAAIQNQYGAATIVKIATDTWIMQGDIGAVA